MCPAWASSGSTSPRKRSGARASMRRTRPSCLPSESASMVLTSGACSGYGATGAGVGTAVSTPAPVAPYPLQAPLVSTIDADSLGKQLGRVRLIDARAPERFRGEVEPLDAQAGHIPGASNRFFKDNLAADGRFKSPEQLKAEWTPLLADGTPVIHQCGSGV